MLTRQLILWLEVSWLNRKPAENINNSRHNFKPSNSFRRGVLRST